MNNYLLPKTFCPRAWHMMNIVPEGWIRMCCKVPHFISKDGKRMSVYEYTFDEIWNSDYMQNIRKSLLENQRIPECSYCYASEDKISTSLRHDVIKWANDMNPFLTDSMKDPEIFQKNYSAIASLPFEYQLDMGSVCNLKCRMCAANRSTRIESDPVHSKWRPEPNDVPQYITSSRFPDHESWIKQKNFIYSELFSAPDQIKLIHISGGEIFLIKEADEIIDFMVDNEYSKNIVFHLTTNGTIISDEILKKLSSFRSIGIGVSIEGVGPVNDYIRFPSQWESTALNIKKLSALPNANIYLACTLQVYNIFYFVELCEYCDENNLKLYTEILRNPSFLNVGVLPSPVLNECVAKLQDYLTRCTNPHRRRVVELLCKRLPEQIPLNRDELWDQFMLFTNDLDISREQRFDHSLSGLYQALLDSGVVWNNQTRYVEREKGNQ